MLKQYSLSQQYDQFMKKTDPYWENKENYRVQEEYKKILKLDPVTPMWLRSPIPENMSMDV